MIWTTQPRSKGAGDLTYWSGGEGPAVVLIHGVGLRAEAWAGVMPKLATRHSVFAIDMPGHGQAPLGTVTTLGDFADHIGEFVQSLDGPVVIGGHSMGAILALMLAEKLPEKVRAVAALNAIYQRTEDATKAVQTRAASLRTDGPSDPTATLARWFGEAPTGALAEARTACGNWLRSVDPMGYKTAYQSFANQDGPTQAMLDALDIPALFMTATGDGNSTPEMSQAMAARAPKGVAHIVADAAHMMPMTHPHVVADALMNTFAETSHV